jgi:hypothetical protein
MEAAMAVTAENLSASAIWADIAAKKQAALAEIQAQKEAADIERAKLREAFEKREIQPEALQRIATLIRRAVEAGEKEAMVLRFPSEWLPDQGRSITSHDPEWRAKLSGFPKRAHDFFVKELQPRGFQLKAQIIDWPNGMPGDVGWFLTWKHPEEE